MYVLADKESKNLAISTNSRKKFHRRINSLFLTNIFFQKRR
jgi:hypothetical protein